MMYRSEDKRYSRPEKGVGNVPDSGRLAIIDIGSNSIRLVVYDRAGRYPFPLFNERITCQLGLDLDKTGILQPENIKAALRALRRFSPILRALAPKILIAAATAAARRAKNADAFLEPAAEILGQPVKVVSASEEARLIANGLISSWPRLTGLVADLGGGSLELVQVDEGEIINATSLNVGHLSSKNADEVADMMSQIPWLPDLEGSKLYGIGGSFRAIGAAHISGTKYPVPLLHGLKIKRVPALALLNVIIKDGDLSAIPADRRETIAMAAQIIKQLMKRSGVNAISISGTSLRDGLVADLHQNRNTDQDPLNAVCSEIAERSERYPGFNESLSRFLQPLAAHFSEVMPERLFIAACQLSDICWNEHPDMRGALAVEKVLALPVFSLSHKERAQLAKSIHHRYVGVKRYKDSIEPLNVLVGRKRGNAAKSIGLALRFAHMYSAGVGSLLDRISLSISDTNVNISMHLEAQQMLDGHSQRRLKLLADSLDRDLIIQSK